VSGVGCCDGDGEPAGLNGTTTKDAVGAAVSDTSVGAGAGATGAVVDESEDVVVDSARRGTLPGDRFVPLAASDEVDVDVVESKGAAGTDSVVLVGVLGSIDAEGGVWFVSPIDPAAGADDTAEPGTTAVELCAVEPPGCGDVDDADGDGDGSAAGAGAGVGDGDGDAAGAAAGVVPGVDAGVLKCGTPTVAIVVVDVGIDGPGTETKADELVVDDVTGSNGI